VFAVIVADNARFNQGPPGIGMEVARWLIARDVILVGSDTWNTEVVPNPDPTMSFVVHNEFMTKNGVYIQENGRPIAIR
jgi:kynurenine formamidase